MCMPNEARLELCSMGSMEDSHRKKLVKDRDLCDGTTGHPSSQAFLTDDEILQNPKSRNAQQHSRQAAVHSNSQS